MFTINLWCQGFCVHSFVRRDLNVVEFCCLNPSFPLSLSFFQEQMAASECAGEERGAGDKEVLPSLPLLLLSSPSLSSHPRVQTESQSHHDGAVRQALRQEDETPSGECFSCHLSCLCLFKSLFVVCFESTYVYFISFIFAPSTLTVNRVSLFTYIRCLVKTVV